MLGLPDEIFTIIIEFLDWESLKALSETNNLLFDMTSSTVVNAMWVEIKSGKMLKEIYSSLRAYCNFKIITDIENLDVNDRRFRAKNLYINGSILKANTSLVEYIRRSKTLSKVFVDMRNFEEINEIPLPDIPNLICSKGYFVIDTDKNPYNQFYTIFRNNPAIEDLYVYSANSGHQQTPPPLEIDWTNSKCHFRFALKKLSCSYIPSKFLEDILQKNSTNLTCLHLDSTHFNKETLPHQLRELCYTGIRDGQYETPAINSASLENLLKNQTKLEIVSVGHVPVTKKALGELALNLRLKVVNFYGTFSTGLVKEDFACLSRIKFLYLHLFQDQDLENFYYMLTNLSEIEVLDIKIPVSDSSLRKFDHLKSNRIRLPKLKKFTCSDPKITQLITEVICAENLESCDLVWVNNIYSNTLLKSLKHLRVLNSTTSFKDFTEICSNKNIESIFIVLNEFTTEVLGFIFEELGHLKKLVINFEKWFKDGDKDKNAVYFENLKLIGLEHDFKVTSNIVQMVLSFEHKHCSMVFRIFDYKF